MSVREHWINVRVNPEELARIREKQKEFGIRNTGAYIRKMAMDGYCVNLDLSDVAHFRKRSLRFLLYSEILLYHIRNFTYRNIKILCQLVYTIFFIHSLIPFFMSDLVLYI